jgi:hypothetical protein
MTQTKITVDLLGEEISKWCHQHLNRNDVRTLHGKNYFVTGGDWSVFVELGASDIPYINPEAHVSLVVLVPQPDQITNIELMHKAFDLLEEDEVPVQDARNIRVEITRKPT